MLKIRNKTAIETKVDIIEMVLKYKDLYSSKCHTDHELENLIYMGKVDSLKILYNEILELTLIESTGGD